MPGSRRNPQFGRRRLQLSVGRSGPHRNFDVASRSAREAGWNGGKARAVALQTLLVTGGGGLALLAGLLLLGQPGRCMSPRHRVACGDPEWDARRLGSAPLDRPVRGAEAGRAFDPPALGTVGPFTTFESFLERILGGFQGKRTRLPCLTLESRYNSTAPSRWGRDGSEAAFSGD
jgi:hypothetical protein